MGNMVIIPHSYKINRVDMGPLVEKKRWKKRSWIQKLFGLGKLSYHKASISHNQVILAELEKDNQKFCIANYHMPCRYMVIFKENLTKFLGLVIYEHPSGPFRPNPECIFKWTSFCFTRGFQYST